MKVAPLTLGFLSFSSCLSLGFFPSNPAFAQCLQADVAVQYNISGSRVPTERTNDVTLESNQGCRGNTSVTTGVQGNVGGTDPVVQNRQVIQRQQGNNNEGGFGGNTVQIQTGVGIDVYNAADQFRH